MHLSIANKNWSADLFQVNVAMCIELCQVHCACLHLIFFGSAELLLSLLSDLHRSWAPVLFRERLSELKFSSCLLVPKHGQFSTSMIESGDHVRQSRVSLLQVK